VRASERQNGRGGERNGGEKGRFWLGFTGVRTEAFVASVRRGIVIFLGFWKNTGGVYYCLPEGDGVVVVGDGRAGGGGDVAPRRPSCGTWGRSGVRVAVAALDVAGGTTGGRNEYVRAQPPGGNV